MGRGKGSYFAGPQLVVPDAWKRGFQPGDLAVAQRVIVNAAHRLGEHRGRARPLGAQAIAVYVDTVHRDYHVGRPVVDRVFEEVADRVFANVSPIPAVTTAKRLAVN